MDKEGRGDQSLGTGVAEERRETKRRRDRQKSREKEGEREGGREEGKDMRVWKEGRTTAEQYFPSVPLALL